MAEKIKMGGFGGFDKANQGAKDSTVPMNAAERRAAERAKLAPAEVPEVPAVVTENAKPEKEKA